MDGEMLYFHGTYDSSGSVVLHGDCYKSTWFLNTKAGVHPLSDEKFKKYVGHREGHGDEFNDYFYRYKFMYIRVPRKHFPSLGVATIPSHFS